EFYRKIRNTFRFMIQNTEDFTPKENSIAYKDLRSIDRYLLNRLDQTVENIGNAFEKYKFNDISKEINHFVTVDLSNFYMNIAKDILYIDAPDAYDRRAIQTVFYQTLVKLTKLLTPIIPYTAEEIWTFLSEEEDYAQLTEMPEVENYSDRSLLLDKWTAFMNVRSDILKANELARENKVIGKDFEAKTTLYVSNDVRELLESLNADLRQVLVASELNIYDLEDKPEQDEEILDLDSLSIKVEHMPGEVCDRCRITTEDIIDLGDKGQVCPRCYKICENHYPELLKEAN
ncbi:MAG: class I tRNA ligase family protein, partial [Atopostipes suicloacalis]|nr:class I tRNA ligase family protein [Atopostipes suicloacalis]